VGVRVGNRAKVRIRIEFKVTTKVRVGVVIVVGYEQWPVSSRRTTRSVLWEARSLQHVSN
jgi:hypothetical protein